MLTYHKKISYLKSIIRIIGYNLLFYSIPFAVMVLVIAEALGIAEEWKE